MSFFHLHSVFTFPPSVGYFYPLEARSGQEAFRPICFATSVVHPPQFEQKVYAIIFCTKTMTHTWSALGAKERELSSQSKTFVLRRPHNFLTERKNAVTYTFTRAAKEE